MLFVLQHPDAGPEAQHENWMRVKETEGWVYGEKKDSEAKTHPCMRPWHELPEAQRIKDIIFRAVVMSHASDYRYNVKRANEELRAQQ